MNKKIENYRALHVDICKDIMVEFNGEDFATDNGYVFKEGLINA